jgi:hypothetical protein
MCKGSIGLVHRQCLDTWRSVSPKPESFYKCDQCLFDYKLIEKKEHDRSCNKFKFAMMVTRDAFVVFLLLNAIIIGLGFFGEAIDSRYFIKIFPGGNFINQYLMLRVYAFGGIVFFAFAGLVGLILLCTVGFSGPSNSYTADTYPYRSGGIYFFYCGPSPGPMCDCGPACCSCTGCHGSGCHGSFCGGSSCSGGRGSSSNDISGGLVVIVVLILILVALGIIFGVILFTFIISKSIHRHAYIVRQKQAAKVFYVANLNDPMEREQAERNAASPADVAIVIPTQERSPLLVNDEKKTKGVETLL